MAGLYIHVPFCLARCRYCDFYREAPLDGRRADRFLEALDEELRRLPRFSPETVFIGGGTPTALDVFRLRRLLELLRRRVDLSAVVEFSCEANPGTLTPEKLAVLREGGVNRLSLGVQSFDDRALRRLGRIHAGREAVEAFRLARTAGFDNIGIDLLQGIPGLSFTGHLADLRLAVELNPEHLSSYNLSYEPGTPLSADRAAGRIVPFDEEAESDLYHAVRRTLLSAGFRHYEISNYARPGCACRHNLLYWTGGEYFGCGPAAFSHWQGERFGNPADLDRWIERLRAGEPPAVERERLPPREKARETLVMNLRLVDGVDEAVFERRTGFSPRALCGDELDRLVEEGLLVRSAGRLSLPPEALFISNTVFRRLLG